MSGPTEIAHAFGVPCRLVGLDVSDEHHDADVAAFPAEPCLDCAMGDCHDCSEDNREWYYGACCCGHVARDEPEDDDEELDDEDEL